MTTVLQDARSDIADLGGIVKYAHCVEIKAHGALVSIKRVAFHPKDRCHDCACRGWQATTQEITGIFFEG